MDNVRDFILLIALACCASGYGTSLICRLAKRRQRSVGWWLSFLGAGVGSVLTMLFIGLGFALQPGQLSYGALIWLWVLKWLPISALAMALLVTGYFRRQITHHAGN